MLKACVLSIVPFVSSFLWRIAADFLAIHVHDRRSRVELPASWHLTLFQRTTENRIQIKHEHTNTTLTAKATHIRYKSCCHAIAKPSAEACDFLAIHAHTLTTDDRLWKPKPSRALTILSKNGWQYITTAPVLTRKHVTDGKRHLPPLQSLLLPKGAKKEKVPSHRESGIWKELPAHRMHFADSSLGPVFQQQVPLKKSC